MPSEKKSKKQKIKKEQMDVDGLKPLANYVDDRVELIRQMFSCLKKKQIKARLPQNLHNKSIERIQQMCLDEILGISSKRLTSIITSTRCPANTESSDSDIEQVVEHVSLEEISSDSEEEQKKAKTNTKKVDNSKKPTEAKSTKEMTMLELLELQARARAIRSQLALEPVTKIELDSDQDEDENVASTSEKTAEKDGAIEKIKITSEKKKPSEPVQKLLEPPASIKKTPVQKPSAPPVKLKRNYKKRQADDDDALDSITNIVKKDPSPVPEKSNVDDDDRCSSPDVITMEPSPITFFISDSEDDDQPPPKILNIDNIKVTIVNPAAKVRVIPAKVEDAEEGEISENESQHSSDKNNEPLEKVRMSPEQTNSKNDDDVVHLMSDTEIELTKDNSDKDGSDDGETQSPYKSAIVKPEILLAKKSNIAQPDYDDDVVAIHNSSDEDLLDDSDKRVDSGKNSDESESWQQRYLSSKNVTSILQTSKLATKVRAKMTKTKKKLKSAKIAEEQIKEKGSAETSSGSHTEGSVQQFQALKDNSNSSV